MTDRRPALRSAEARSALTGSEGVALGALIAIEVAIVYALLRGGGWVYDDNLFMVLAGRNGLTWGWLDSLLFQHWGIGYHLMFSGVHTLMPVDYRWALAGMLVLLAGSIFLLQRITRLLFASAWVPLWVAAYFGLSIILVRALQWAAGGFAYLPNTFLDLLCLYGYVRFQAQRSWRWAAVCAGALAGGLLFYEKPLFMLLYLAMIQALLLSEDLRPRALARRFWMERMVWAGLLLVVLLWGVGFVSAGGGSGVARGNVTLGQYAHYFRILWVQTLVPAAAGLTFPATLRLTAGQTALAIGLQLAVLVAVAASVRRKRSAWRAWLLLIVAVLATGLAIARARIAQFGIGAAGDSRYLLDFAWLAPLTVAFAFSRERVLRPDRTGPTRLGLPSGPSLQAAALALALAAYVAASVTSARALQRDWAGHRGRAWETQLQSGLGSLERAGLRPVVADAVVPRFIIEQPFSPYNRLSWVAPLYDPRVRVDGPLDGPLVTIDGMGAVVRAAIATRLVLYRRGREPASARVGRPGPRVASRCGASARWPASIELPVPKGRLRGARPPYYLVVAYRARRAASLPLYVDSGRGFPGATDRWLAVAPGRASSLLFLAAPSPRYLRLITAPGGPCVKRIDLVTLRASG